MDNPPADSNGFGLKVGGTPGYDVAFIDDMPSTNQIVEAQVYIEVDGREDFSFVGIFARGKNADFHGKRNCCFSLSIDTKTGRVNVKRHLKGYEWPLRTRDPEGHFVKTGWHILQIKAVDKSVEAFVDDELIASAVTPACLGGICAGVFNKDPEKNRERKNYTIIDDFSLTEVSDEMVRLSCVSRAIYIRRKVHKHLLELQFGEEAMSYGTTTRRILSGLLGSSQSPGVANEYYSMLRHCWDEAGMGRYAAEIEESIHEGETIQECIKSASGEYYADSVENPYGVRFSLKPLNIQEFEAYYEKYYELDRLLGLDIEEAIGNDRPTEEVRLSSDLRVRLKIRFTDIVERIQNMCETALPEESAYDFLVSIARATQAMGLTKETFGVFEAAANSPDQMQRLGAFSLSLGYALSTNSYGIAANLYRNLSLCENVSDASMSEFYIGWTDLLEKASRSKEAADLCKTFLLKFPKSDFVEKFQLRRARLLQEIGHSEQVIEVVNSLLDGEPKNSIRGEALLYLGLARMKLKNWKKALSTFEEMSMIATTDEESARVLLLSAYCATALSDSCGTKEALECIEQKYPQHRVDEQVCGWP